MLNDALQDIKMVDVGFLISECNLMTVEKSHS